jgi:hypothetical protein
VLVRFGRGKKPQDSERVCNTRVSSLKCRVNVCKMKRAIADECGAPRDPLSLRIRSGLLR